MKNKFDDLEQAQSTLIKFQSILNNDGMFKISEDVNKALNTAIDLINSTFAQKDSINKGADIYIDYGIMLMAVKLKTYCYQNGKEEFLTPISNIENRLLKIWKD